MKKRTIFIIAGIIILCLLAVVATHSKGTKRQSLKKMKRQIIFYQMLM